MVQSALTWVVFCWSILPITHSLWVAVCKSKAQSHALFKYCNMMEHSSLKITMNTVLVRNGFDGCLSYPDSGVLMATSKKMEIQYHQFLSSCQKQQISIKQWRFWILSTIWLNISLWTVCTCQNCLSYFNNNSRMKKIQYSFLALNYGIDESYKSYVRIYLSVHAADNHATLGIPVTQENTSAIRNIFLQHCR